MFLVFIEPYVKRQSVLKLIKLPNLNNQQLKFHCNLQSPSFCNRNQIIGTYFPINGNSILRVCKHGDAHFDDLPMAVPSTRPPRLIRSVKTKCNDKVLIGVYWFWSKEDCQSQDWWFDWRLYNQPTLNYIWSTCSFVGVQSQHQLC